MTTLNAVGQPPTRVPTLVPPLVRFTLWLLYLVEFADWNTQKTIGKGCGNNSAAQNMGYTDSMPYHTGTNSPRRQQQTG